MKAEILNTPLSKEEYYKRVLERKNPDNPRWSDARFDMIDGCHCILFGKDGSILVYTQGSSHDTNLFIWPMLAEAIAKEYNKK